MSEGANSHFDWDKAKMDPEQMEEELAKLPSESDRDFINRVLSKTNANNDNVKS